MHRPDPSGLFAALALAPATFSRNRYFALFEEDDLKQSRRRSRLVRSMARELTEPWHLPGGSSAKPGPSSYTEEARPEGILVSYRVDELEYQRAALLTRLEVAALHYLLARSLEPAGAVAPTAKSPTTVSPLLPTLTSDDRALVEGALSLLDPLREPGENSLD